MTWTRRFAIAACVAASLALAMTLRSPAGAAAERDAVWTSYFAVKDVWAYADRHSVVAGEAFDLMLSTGPRSGRITGHVEWQRVGASGLEMAWRGREVAVEHVPVSRTAPSLGANWAPTYAGLSTAGWRPGVYTAAFVHAGTGMTEPDIAQIVVRPATARGGILLKLGTNTYQAYNRWGGHGLYPSDDITARGEMVSFDRPADPAFFEYDVFIVRWLEHVAAEFGESVDYASDHDVHADPALLSAYKLVLSSAHDEYWTAETYDAFEHRIHNEGRNVIFLGANAAYWQIRYADVNRPAGDRDRGRQMITFKGLRDPIARRVTPPEALRLATGRFRDAGRRPETMLMGVGYQGHFDPRSEDDPVFDYRIASVEAPFFAGTGYAVGDVVARLVGYEWDNTDPEGDGRRLLRPETQPTALLPRERIQVLMAGEPVDVDGRTGRAEAVYFVSSAGAQVFSAGTVRWSWGLGKPGFADPRFERFNRNLLRHFLATAR